ncbi:MAG TPA: biopolymer transporter ExbD [Chthoniobacterales bacterium]
MRLPARASKRKPRIEIIPLIDIMFFLLACFMLVSLQMIQMRGVKVNLPSVANSTPEKKSDFITVTVDPLGGFFWEKEKLDADQLYEHAKTLRAENKDARIYVRGDKDALHGEVMGALDKLRSAGVEKVVFEIKATSATAAAPAGAPPATN